MTDDPLYPRALLRLAADGQGAGLSAHPDVSASRNNPACGDRVTVALRLADGRITALSHDTQACILTQASAAVLAGLAPGQDQAGLQALADAVRAMLGGGNAVAGYAPFQGVAEHSGRQTCVMLPLEAALDALAQAEAH